MNSDELQYVVEELIDKNGIVQVLDAMGETCFLKEEHILSVWQDKPLTKEWRRNGIILQKAAGKLFDLP